MSTRPIPTRGRGAAAVALRMAGALALSAWCAAPVVAGDVAPGNPAPTEAGYVIPTGTRHVRFVCEARFAPPATAKKVRIWMPLAQTGPAQVVRASTVSVSPDGGEGFEVATHPDPDGDRMVDDAGNAVVRVDVNRADTGGAMPEAIEVRVVFEVTRAELLAKNFRGAGAAPLTADEREEHARFLAPSRLVATTGPIAAAAGQLADGEANLLNLARRFYDRVRADMRYDKPAGGQWGRGDATWACGAGFGNCTDFHSYFLGLCRATGIPARFHMGFPLPPARGSGEVAGYHCWASFYIPQLGWVPVDISEADKHPELGEYYFGGLTEDRIEFTIGRDLRLPGMQADEPANYLIYPYVEVDGAPVTDGLTRSYAFEDIEPQ